MTRLLLGVCCVVLALPAWTQNAPFARRGPECPAQPAECEISVQVFDFGRGQMSQQAPPINGFGSISVTCTRARQLRGDLNVRVDYLLKAVPATPARQLRDNALRFLRYDMFLDPAHTRYWGDGYVGGTFAIQGALFLDDRNRVSTLVHQLYGRVDGGQIAAPGQWLGLVGAKLEYTAFCTA